MRSGALSLSTEDREDGDFSRMLDNYYLECGKENWRIENKSMLDAKNPKKKKCSYFYHYQKGGGSVFPAVIESIKESRIRRRFWALIIIPSIALIVAFLSLKNDGVLKEIIELWKRCT